MRQHGTRCWWIIQPSFTTFRPADARAHRHCCVFRRRRGLVLSNDLCRGRSGRLVPHAHPEVSIDGFALARQTIVCIFIARYLERCGRVDARLRQQACQDRRGLPDLPGQHNSPGAPLSRRAPVAPAMAAYSRWVVATDAARRGFRTPRAYRHALACEQRGSTRRTYCLAACSLCVRTRASAREINRIIMDELVCGVFKSEAVSYFQKVIARMKRRRLRCRSPRLHRNPTDHRRLDFAAADTRFHQVLLARAALRKACVVPQLLPA